MAVEAHHLHHFPSQLIRNRETICNVEHNANTYSSHMGFGINENLIPFYGYSPLIDPISAMTTTNNAADSGLTCNLSTPRKRLRDFNDLIVDKDRSSILSNHHLLSFLGEDFSLLVLQQQAEMDRFITQHMEKARMDLSESRKRHSKQIIAAVEEGMMKRLKAKEEEIEKMGRLNWALEEKVKSLCMENQIWRDLARTNEATAIALRSNLEQVLAQAGNYRQCKLEEDAESCCDSNEDDERHRSVEEGEKDKRRWCRNCEKEESSVLLLPCRHLCLCTKCSSGLNTCPICKANKSGSVHVNIS